MLKFNGLSTIVQSLLVQLQKSLLFSWENSILKVTEEKVSNLRKEDEAPEV